MIHTLFPLLGPLWFLATDQRLQSRRGGGRQSGAFVHFGASGMQL